MSKCPVCGNAAALVAGARRVPGAAQLPWSVSCPNCQIPFEIDGKDLNLALSNARELPARQRRWKQLLDEAAHRGEKRARLY